MTEKNGNAWASTPAGGDAFERLRAVIAELGDPGTEPMRRIELARVILDLAEDDEEASDE